MRWVARDDAGGEPARERIDEARAAGGRSSGTRLDARVVARALLVAAFALSGVGFVLASAGGAWRWAAGVPVGDSWDGYLNFYLQALRGNHHVWLASGNEHRLIFSRLLFWIDLHYLGGQLRLLLPFNFVLMGLLWVSLAGAAWRLVDRRRWLALIVVAWLAATCFSWLQWQNITWEYQSQFFGAYAFPSVAFLALALADAERSGRRWFALACLSGALSATTMANGTLALPLLCAMTVVGGRDVRRRLAVLIPLTALVLGAYFSGYRTREVPTASLLEMARFVFEFLGAPLHAALGRRELAVPAGAAFCAGVAYLAIAWRRDSPRRDPLVLALLVLLAYVVASAMLAARRRALMPHDPALSPRYATAALAAWAAFGVLVVHRVREAPRAHWVAVAGLALSIALLLPQQVSALGSRGPGLARARYLGALALNLGVRDTQRIRLLYPNDNVYDVAAQAQVRNLSVFAQSTMVRSRQAVGRQASALGLRRCDGRVDARTALPDDPNALFVRGWAFDRRRERAPREVYLVDGQGDVVGFALTGPVRRRTELLVGKVDEPIDFDGYLVRVTEEPLTLYVLP